jgi:5'-nucleotidase
MIWGKTHCTCWPLRGFARYPFGVRILLVNDDGIHAEGLRVLASVAAKHGEVKIVAPLAEQSACGHGMTLREPLRVVQVPWEGIEAYSVNGMPADCVNVGIGVAWPDGCDLIISGINDGPNLGFDVTYSGTVAGAMEGAINRIRSVAVSMAKFVSGSPTHYETAAAWLDDHWNELANSTWHELMFLNINVPNIAPTELRGQRIAPMGKRVYQERLEAREDPWGRPYYWQGGVVAMSPSEQPGTDVEAVSDGFVSITPVSLDWTDYSLLDSLRDDFRRV